MRWLSNTCTDPFYNMALDEWCLQNGPKDEVIFYLWRNSPSVIIGISQNQYTEVNLQYLKEHNIHLVRRSTGGGAVYHDLENLNYSFVGPLSILGTTAEDEHPSAVKLIAQALSEFGVNAEVSGRNDIFVDGHKVSGYAKRVWKDRCIVHGTLMYNVDIDTLTHVLDTPESKLHKKGVASVRSRVTNLRDLLPFASLDELQSALQSRLSKGDSQLILTPEEIAEVEAISQGKYSTHDWIEGKWTEND